MAVRANGVQETAKLSTRRPVEPPELRAVFLKCLAHLPGDLAFADDEAVQARGDSEQMLHRGGIGEFVQVRPKIARDNVVELAKEFGHEIAIGRPLALRFGEIELDAVAGAQDGTAPSLIEAVACGQFAQRPLQLGIVEGDAFPQLDRSPAETAPDGNQVHRESPGTNGCEAPSATSIRAKAAIVNQAIRRPGKWAP